MNVVYLGLGGNLGNRAINLHKAVLLVKKHIGTVTKQSSVYETSSWGNPDLPDFLNQVIEVETDLSPSAVLNACRLIEQSLGREEKTTGTYESRFMDIDILLYNDLELKLEVMEIPHPRFHLRKFVLIPLAEINSNLIHPVLQKKISDLLSASEDTGLVKLFEGPLA